MIAALVLLAIVGGWEAYVQLSGIDEFLLPAPSAIAGAINDDAALLWSNFAVTAGEIALGIAAALALGLACSVAIHFSDTLRRALYPLLVGSQTVQIPLIAPLLVVWFGFGLTPKIAIVALVCFFPPWRSTCRPRSAAGATTCCRSCTASGSSRARTWRSRCRIGST